MRIGYCKDGISKFKNYAKKVILSEDDKLMKTHNFYLYNHLEDKRVSEENLEKNSKEKKDLDIKNQTQDLDEKQLICENINGTNVFICLKENHFYNNQRKRIEK